MSPLAIILSMENDKNKSEEERPWIHESEIVKRIRKRGLQDLDDNFIKAENKTERLVAITEVFSKHYSHLRVSDK